MALKSIEATTVWGPGTTVFNYKRYRMDGFFPSREELNAMAGDMDGYKYTWEGAGSSDGVTIKANDPVHYPSFYKFGHYRNELIASGVNLTGVMATKNWHFPSAGEFQLFVKNLGYGEQHPTEDTKDKWASTAVNLGLKEVGEAGYGIVWIGFSTMVIGNDNVVCCLLGDENVSYSNSFGSESIPFIYY